MPLIPNWPCEMRFTQYAVGPSSLSIYEVYLVCSGPLIPPERWSLHSVKPAPHPREMKVSSVQTAPHPF